MRWFDAGWAQGTRAGNTPAMRETAALVMLEELSGSSMCSGEEKTKIWMMMMMMIVMMMMIILRAANSDSNDRNAKRKVAVLTGVISRQVL